MRNEIISAALAVGIFGVLAAPAQAQNIQPHAHGVGEMTVVADGATLAITLAVPGADIVGFEHPAESPSDIAKVRAALARLGDPASLFALPKAAECRVTEADAETSLIETAAHDDKQGREHAHEPGHGGFAGHYTYACAQPGALARIDVKLFTAFPSLGEVHVQWAGPAGQSAAVLRKDAVVLSLTR